MAPDVLGDAARGAVRKRARLRRGTTLSNWTGMDDNLQAIAIERSTEVLDPFEGLRAAAQDRLTADQRWREEVRAVRALGFSLRVIAEAAGVSHDTVWKEVR